MNKREMIVKLHNEEKITNREIASRIGSTESYVSIVLRNHGIRTYEHVARSEEEIPLEGLQFAEPKKPKLEKVNINGKQYTDITDYFL